MRPPARITKRSRNGFLDFLPKKRGKSTNLDPSEPTMRNQGPLSSWNDEKGYGFIEPEGGGLRAFVHIKAFLDPIRRPVAGDVLTYEPHTDPRGRAVAQQILFLYQTAPSRDQPRRQQPSGRPHARPERQGTGRPGFFPWILMLLFLAALWALHTKGYLHLRLLAWYPAISLLAFIAYWRDKRAAQRQEWRTAESTLQLFALLGGWPGALLAQRCFRHKTSKTSFQVVFWINVLLHCSLLGGLLFTPQGQQLLRPLLTL